MKLRWYETAGYLLIVMAACFWAASASFGKILMKEGISTIQLMELRSVISSAVLFALLAVFSRAHLRIRWSDIPWLILLAIPGLALVNASYYQAVQLMPVAVAAFIQFTAPVLIFLYGVLTRTEQFSAGKLVALLLGLSGTYLMLQLKTDGTGQWPVFGLVCAFLSMLSYAFYVLVSHRLSKKHSPWTLVAYSYGIASLFWCLLAPPWITSAVVLERGLLGRALLFSVFSTLIPFTVFLIGLRRVSPTGASIASTAETVMAALFAFLFLNETLAPKQIVGAALIITAVLLLILQQPPAAVDPAAQATDHGATS